MRAILGTPPKDGLKHWILGTVLKDRDIACIPMFAGIWDVSARAMYGHIVARPILQDQDYSACSYRPETRADYFRVAGGQNAAKDIFLDPDTGPAVKSGYEYLSFEDLSAHILPKGSRRVAIVFDMVRSRFKKEDYAANIVQYLSDTELGAFAYYGTHMYLLFTGRNREEPEAVKRLITASCPKERVIDVR